MYVWALLLGFVSEKDKTHTPVQEAIGICLLVQRERVAFAKQLLLDARVFFL